MKFVFKSVVPVCASLMFWGGLGMPRGGQVPSKTGTEIAEWTQKVVAAYQKTESKLPPLPILTENQREQESWLRNLYATKPSGSMEATAIAYWGAMQFQNADGWVKRMLRGNNIQRKLVPTSLEDDALEVLPQALESIYKNRASRAALEALIDLSLDGHYQENLDDVRIRLFFARPLEFVSLLQQRPDEQPWHRKGKRNDGFTFSLIYWMSEEQRWFQEAVKLRKRFQHSKSSREAFLYRYLTVTINEAKQRHQQ